MYKLRTNKNASLIHSNIVFLILAIITILLIISTVNIYFQSSEYAQSNLACNLFFKNIEGKSAYWGPNTDTLQIKLINGIENLCSSKEVNIDEKSISDAAQIVKDCWFKTAEGVDIFGNNVRGQGICVYCGRIIVGEDIENFNELFENELKKERYKNLFSRNTDAINMNARFMKLVPEMLEKGDNLDVFYYTYQPEYADDPGVWTFFQDDFLKDQIKYLNSNSDLASFVSQYITPDLVTPFSSVVLTSSINSDMEELDEFEVSPETCKFIIPLEHYD